mmetsp:Transcript_73097/g.191615  ORF Transcript_73097/g.191615 Transcript_73097/m.191615 type:complete len:200 (+) Transcript_73097:129-728(+)
MAHHVSGPAVDGRRVRAVEEHHGQVAPPGRHPPGEGDARGVRPQERRPRQDGARPAPDGEASELLPVELPARLRRQQPRAGRQAGARHDAGRAPRRRGRRAEVRPGPGRGRRAHLARPLSGLGRPGTPRAQHRQPAAPPARLEGLRQRRQVEDHPVRGQLHRRSPEGQGRPQEPSPEVTRGPAPLRGRRPGRAPRPRSL